MARLGVFVLLHAATFGLACSFDLDAVSPPLPDRPSVQIVDAGTDTPRVDRPADLRAPDRRPPDLLKSDTRAADTRAPDTRSPDLKPPPPPPKTCDELYKGAQGYQLCEQKVASCRFYAWTSKATCDATCKAFGGSCVGAQNNSGTGMVSKCIPTFEWMDCFQAFDDQICECSRF